MKKKYFFRGLGFGLIIGALVMMVGIKSGSFADTKKNDPSKEDAVGVVEIILILVVLISLVVIFKEQLTALVKKILAKITKQSNAI